MKKAGLGDPPEGPPPATKPHPYAMTRAERDALRLFASKHVGVVELKPEVIRALLDAADEWDEMRAACGGFKRGWQQARAAAAKISDEWISPATIQLRAGEMTKKEFMSVRAVVRAIDAAIRALAPPGDA